MAEFPGVGGNVLPVEEMEVLIENQKRNLNKQEGTTEADCSNYKVLIFNILHFGCFLFLPIILLPFFINTCL